MFWKTAVKMVPELRVLSLKVILQNIDESTPLSKLNSRDLGEVCDALPLDLILPTALALPLDDSYWRRRALAHYPPPNLRLKIRRQRQRKRTVRDKSNERETEGGDVGTGRGDGVTSEGYDSGSEVSKRAGSAKGTTATSASNMGGLPPINVIKCEDNWQQAYLETYLAQVISSTFDNKRGWRLLNPLLKLCEPYVVNLHLTTLAPATPSKEARRGGGKEEQGSLEHLNMFDVISSLPNLQRLSIRYQTVVEGGDLCWGDHGISLQDASFLSSAVMDSNITYLSIYESCLDDGRAEVLLRPLRNHQPLRDLNLQNNFLSCASVSVLCDIISSTSLKSLSLLHNRIESKGAKLLGATLSESPPLRYLVLDLNPIRSAGGTAILEGAANGRKLQMLSMAGCRLMDECWKSVALALTSVPQLRYICLAANPFQQKPPEDVVSAADNVATAGRVLLTNLDGKTYLLGHVEEGSVLPPPLQELRNDLESPLTSEAADDDIAHYLPLHGLHLQPRDFTLEEEIEGLCLVSNSISLRQ